MDGLETLRIIDENGVPEGSHHERRLWMITRQALIMQLGAIEDYLDMPRSIVPRRKRDHERDERKAS